VTIEGLQRAAEHNGQRAAVLSLTPSDRGRSQPGATRSFYTVIDLPSLGIYMLS
jgi:hypothetical protein